MPDFQSRSPRFNIGAQYFIYFGVLGVFLPYFNLYCYHIGFSGFQIGVISSLRSVMLILFPLAWGALADRYQIRRPIYIACNVISTLAWAFFLFTDRFVPMLIIMVAYGAFQAPIISFLETFAMETLGRAKSAYGKLRAWGSISFICVVLVLGRIIDILSIDIIVVLILAGSSLLAAGSLNIPRVSVERKQSVPGEVRSFIFRKRVMVFLSAAFLMLLSHGTYYGFFSIHLESLGYGKTFIGAMWALASTAEIIVMIRSEKLFNKFSLEGVLSFSFAAALVRWGAMAFASSSAAILALQVLHAFTYGTFHMASILYMDRLSPENDKTLGQAVNNAITYGLGLMVGFFINGLLYERFGSQLLFGVSGGIAAAGGVVFWVGLTKKQVGNGDLS